MKFSLFLFDGKILFLFQTCCTCAQALNENTFDNCLQELEVEMQSAAQKWPFQQTPTVSMHQ